MENLSNDSGKSVDIHQDAREALQQEIYEDDRQDIHGDTYQDTYQDASNSAHDDVSEGATGATVTEAAQTDEDEGKKAKKKGDKGSKKAKGDAKKTSKEAAAFGLKQGVDAKRSKKAFKKDKTANASKASDPKRLSSATKQASSARSVETSFIDRRVAVSRIPAKSTAKAALPKVAKQSAAKDKKPETGSLVEQFQKTFPYVQNRELSWLEFNKRVLDQGADPTVPLFERLGFISIFWSNLQEFFMIRVGSLTDLALVKKTIIDSKSGMTPSEQLEAVYARCHQLYPYYEKCYQDLRDLLRQEGITNLTQKGLDSTQALFVEHYFDMNVMPFLSPQIINARHPFPHLENGALYIVVRLDEEAAIDKASKSTAKNGKDGKKKKGVKNQGAKGVTLGLIPLPRQCKRIVQLPGDGVQFMLLEHLIEMFVPKIFSMYKVKHTNVICVTRNADLDATEGIEEQGEDYREHMKRILKKRARLAPVRLESERELSATVKPVLMERLNLKPHQLFVTSVPLNMSYVYELPDLVNEAKRAALTYEPFSPQWPVSIDKSRSVMEQVSEHEILLSYPYETMEAFVQLLREAAADPDVISIRITLYRLAKQSHLAEALIAAADAGKEVIALFELRARFDESNNIEWSQRFDQAGCNVLYGFRDYKVHSKICCITRQTDDGLQYITQLGTGNYNEKTAKLYTDFCFITTDKRIGMDAMNFFRNMALENTSDDYDVLWVAPLQIKQNILSGIDEQIARHAAGQSSGIFFKTNSITDKEIIDKIVEASQAGVKCTLLVRGISCIVPGIQGFTDNVCVGSIVGRLLEHSRIYCFGPFDGDVKVYLSSADLMTRNMDKRIEIAWPVIDDDLRDQIIGYIGTCMADTAKLRDLLPSREYTALGLFAKTSDPIGRVELFDSQVFLIEEAYRKHLAASEELAAGVAGNADLVRELDDVQMDAEHLSDVLGEEVAEFQDATDAIVEEREEGSEQLVQDLPYIEGAAKYEIVDAADVTEDTEILELPNFESDETVSLPVVQIAPVEVLEIEEVQPVEDAIDGAGEADVSVVADELGDASEMGATEPAVIEEIVEVEETVSAPDGQIIFDEPREKASFFKRWFG